MKGVFKARVDRRRFFSYDTWKIYLLYLQVLRREIQGSEIRKKSAG